MTRLTTLFLLAMTALTTACGGDDDATPDAAGGTPDAAGATADAAVFPCSPAASCTTPTGLACLSLTENQGDAVFGLRMSQINFTKPSSFTTGIVSSVIAGGALPNVAGCNLNGTATFSWLLQFDTTAGTLKTGGAKPVADPTQGYSFDNGLVGGIPVNPAVANTVPDASGDFAVTTGIDALAMPIYLDEGATQVIVLPMRKLTMQGTVSADHNCIGSYNAEGLDPMNSCLGDSTTPTFLQDANFSGHMTLEDADSVIISPLNQSLCVLLSGDAATFGDGGNPAKCKRTGGVIDFKGDWCDATDSAGGCMDAMQIGGTFAASAVTINN